MAIVAAVAVCAVSCSKKIDAQKDKFVNPTKVDVVPPTASLIPGGTVVLTARVSPADARQAVNWKSSDPAVARVNANGEVTAVAVGVATVRAVCAEDSKLSDQCIVSVVEENIPVQDIAISPAEAVIGVGSTLNFSYILTPPNATDHDVVWTSRDESIITVSSTGLVTAKGRGNTTVTVATKDGAHHSSAAVRVVEPFASVSITYPSGTYIDLTVGDDVSIQASGSPSYADDRLIYSSSDESIASVDASGVLHAVKASANYVTITVASEANPKVNKRFNAYVYDKPTGFKLLHRPEVENYSSSLAFEERSSEYIGKGHTQFYLVEVLPSTAKQGAFSVSTNSAILSVSKSGSGFSVTSTGSSTSTKSSKVYGTVTISSAGVSEDFDFYISVFDPWLPKPGDGLYYYTINNTKTLHFYDCGYRGREIFESSVGTPFNRLASGKGSVFAIIGYIGDEQLSEDPLLKSNSKKLTGMYYAPAGYKHGIAIPVNTSYVRTVSGDWASSGVRFSSDKEDLTTATSHYPTYKSKISDFSIMKNADLNNERKTAFTNTQLLIDWNDDRGGSYDVLPAFFLHPDHDWYFGISTNTTINAASKVGMYIPLTQMATNTPWCFGTWADYSMIFADMHVNTMTVMVTTKLSIFENATQFFTGSAKSYVHSYWCAQQGSDKNSAVEFEISASGQLSTDKSKDKASGRADVLPVIYY